MSDFDNCGLCGHFERYHYVQFREMLAPRVRCTQCPLASSSHANKRCNAEIYR